MNKIYWLSMYPGNTDGAAVFSSSKELAEHLLSISVLRG